MRNSLVVVMWGMAGRIRSGHVPLFLTKQNKTNGYNQHRMQLYGQ